MTEPKAECVTCGTSILRSTAASNHGRCKPCSKGPSFDNIVEGLGVGVRLMLGVFFAVLIGGVGFAIGSSLATIVGVLVAVPLAMVGFVYGCFCREINMIIRSVLPFLFDQ